MSGLDEFLREFDDSVDGSVGLTIGVDYDHNALVVDLNDGSDSLGIYLSPDTARALAQALVNASHYL